MKILIVGSGGREHTLAWKISQSEKVDQLFIAPGNAGTARFGENVDIDVEDLGQLLKFAKNEKIDLTVIGPEKPLALGITDLFEKNGLSVFGPSKKAARIEASKVFANKFMKKFGIPSADFKVFSDYEKAKDHLENDEFPVVLKADGLAAGKGVFVCQNKVESLKALKAIMREKKFGSAGDRLVIEECLFGQEASLICFTDGKTVLPLLPAQDHKPVFDGGKGPNTGGMGAYAPTPIVDAKLLQKVVDEILKPAVFGMKRAGHPYKGILYAGLMLTENGPKVLEFNCRFGDPETQPQLMLMESDLVELLLAGIEGKLRGKKIDWYPGYSVCVVMASGGYPGEYQKGFEIKGLPKKASPDLEVFLAGAKKDGQKIVTNGVRVLGVTSRAPTLKKAITRAYGQVEKIDFKNKSFRTDIGGSYQ